MLRTLKVEGSGRRELRVPWATHPGSGSARWLNFADSTTAIIFCGRRNWSGIREGGEALERLCLLLCLTRFYV